MSLGVPFPGSVSDTRWHREEGKGSATLPSHQEQDTADSQVGEQHEEPHSGRKGIQEGEVAGSAALGRQKKPKKQRRSWSWLGLER